MNIVDRMLNINNSTEIIEQHYHLTEIKEDQQMEMKRDLNDTIKVILEMTEGELASFKNDIKHASEYITYKSITKYEKEYIKKVRDILDMHFYDRMSFNEIQIKMGLIDEPTEEIVEDQQKEINRDINEIIKSVLEENMDLKNKLEMAIKGQGAFKKIINDKDNIINELKNILETERDFADCYIDDLKLYKNAYYLLFKNTVTFLGKISLSDHTSLETRLELHEFFKFMMEMIETMPDDPEDPDHE